MGWASGSSLLSGVWGIVRSHVAEDKRVKVLVHLMSLFANEDCDTLGEIVCDEWPETQEAYETLYPPEDE